jgi:cyclopropane-fatty-acyl-phospholipid synthase
MDRLLRFVMSRFIRRGNLRITSARGRTFRFGDGTGRQISVRFTTRAAQRQVLLNPELKLGECYVDGTFVVEDATIAEFLALAMGQPNEVPNWGWPLQAARYLKRRFQQFNPPRRARRNVAHHYDLDGRLYSLFLDADRQYSCGYFESLGQSLDDAQLAKKRHLGAKLLLKPGQRVLDIGCGWGGLALYLAEVAGADVVGVTLSQEQLGIAQARASEKDLAGAVEFRLQDYRDIKQGFDRIVSVGMFEHVGVVHYDRFFRKCAEVLDDEGVIVLHSIGRSEGPGTTNPWIAKYIFPGGYIPALSEVLPAIERAGLLVDDIEILRLHYAETLKAWRDRFMAHRDEVQRIYDPRFVRMWEFYLASSEMAFREQAMMVFQLQLSKRQGVVPITRDYIGREEARLRAIENGQRPPLRLAGE